MADQLLVAGFHRSGTSLFAQLLHRAGLFLGSDLLDARPSNPFGHFEDVEVVRLHDHLLTDNGTNWHVTEPFIPAISRKRWAQMESIVRRRNSQHALWGFKDPRACMFLSAWKYLLPSARVVVVYRHVADATHSLERRHAGDLTRAEGPVHLHRLFWKEPDHALRMWLTHNAALVAFARAYPEDTLVVSFDQLRAGIPILRLIEDRWALGLRDVATFDVFDPTVTEERIGRQPLADRRLAGRVTRVWNELEAASASLEETARA